MLLLYLPLSQELREHSFLRPTEKPARGGPAQGDVKLSKEQLQRLLMKVSQASGGNAIDMQQLSEQLYQQMVDGLSPEIVRKQSSRTNSNVEEQKFIPVGNPAAGGQSRMPLMPVKDNVGLECFVFLLFIIKGTQWLLENSLIPKCDFIFLAGITCGHTSRQTKGRRVGCCFKGRIRTIQFQ